jgi:hypothetical protein
VTAHPAGRYEIELIDESCYTIGSADNVRDYIREYLLCDGRPSSRHGVICREGTHVKGTAVLLAGGGCTGVHDSSLLALDEHVYVAVGDQVACLEFPQLLLAWNVEGDEATVFGIHATPQRDGLIVHGELLVSRMTLDGEIVWSAGGADIFTGKLVVADNHVRVSDFQEHEYGFDLITGREISA